MAIFNLRDYFGDHTRAVSTYKVSRVAITALELQTTYIRASAHNFDDYDQLIMAEMPVSLIGKNPASFSRIPHGALFNQLIEFTKKDRNVCSLNAQPIEFYNEFINIAKKRAGDLPIDWHRLEQLIIKAINNPVTVPIKDKAIVGDSHSGMLWTLEYNLIDMPGRTLWGYLKNPPDLSNYKEIIFNLGSIDLQHHLSSVVLAEELALKYISYINNLDCAVKVQAPVPTLPDEHNIKKIYYYKNKKFVCDYEHRLAIRQHFINILKDNVCLLDWQPELYTYAPNQFGIKDIHYRNKYYAFISNSK